MCIVQSSTHEYLNNSCKCTCMVWYGVRVRVCAWTEWYSFELTIDRRTANAYVWVLRVCVCVYVVPCAFDCVCVLTYIYWVQWNVHVHVFDYPQFWSGSTSTITSSSSSLKWVFHARLLWVWELRESGALIVLVFGQFESFEIGSNTHTHTHMHVVDALRSTSSHVCFL